MCAPAVLAVASFAVGAAQAVVGHQAAQADYDARMQQYRQNYVNALSAARDEQGQILLRMMQEGNATGQKLHLSRLEEAEKRAEAQVRGSAAGVSGLSVDNLITDVTRQSAYNRTVERENYNMTAAQLTKELDATNIRARARIDSVPLPTPPSSAALLVGIAGAGVNAFSMMKQG